MVFQWSLSDSKFHQVSRTLLSILDDLNKAVVWIFFTRSLISRFSRPCTNPLMTLPSAQTFLFHRFFRSLLRTRYLCLFTFSFSFTLWLAGKVKSTIRRSSFLLTTTMSGRLAEIRWSVWFSKPQRVLCVLISRTYFWSFIYPLFVWSNLNFFHTSQGITFPTLSCLVLYVLSSNLQHSLIKWLVVSSVCPHNLHLLFCCLAYFCFVIVLMALVCAGIRRDSVSLLRFPFLSHVQVFLRKISLVCRFKFPYNCIYYHFFYYYYYYYYCYYYLLIRVFHISVSGWSFTGVWVTASLLKSLSILAILNNVVVWMVSTRPPTSKSSSPFSNPLVTNQNALITIGIIVTCMFHSFFNSLARSRYLSFFSHSLSFIL